MGITAAIHSRHVAEEKGFCDGWVFRRGGEKKKRQRVLDASLNTFRPHPTSYCKTTEHGAGEGGGKKNEYQGKL